VDANAVLTVTVTNTGGIPTGDLTAAFDSGNSFIINGGSAGDPGTVASIAVSGTDTFTVQPVPGLAVGTHTAAITVSNSGAGVSARLTLSFTVTKVLTGIAVSTQPTRTVFYVGETLTATAAGSFAGIVVTATYSDSSTANVTGQASFTNPGTATAGEAISVTVTVGSKDNTFDIKVRPVFIGIPGSGGTGYASLNAAITAAASGATITLYADVAVDNDTNPNGKTITLKGYGSERKITHTSIGRMFNLSGVNTTLILDQYITLDGDRDGDGIGDSNGANTLVRIDSNAELKMKTGSTITGGNNNQLMGGGGVIINGGTFEMSGGTISGNSAPYVGSGGGGGVLILSGQFTMSGGTISGNSASFNGGGVCITGSSTFNIVNPATLSNITGNNAPLGEKVYQYSGTTFTIGGALATGETNSDGGNPYWDD
jgi:hypothetical protein